MPVGIRRPAGSPASEMAVDSVTSQRAASEPLRMTSALHWDRLSKDVPHNPVVARRGARDVPNRDVPNRDVHEGEFRARVRDWRSRFAALSEPSIALYEPDGAEFAAALLGAWYANKTVFLPGDTQQNTCTALIARNAKLVGAFPPEFEPLPTAMHLTRRNSESNVEAPGHEFPADDRDDGARTPDRFSPLDTERAVAIIFTSGSTGEPQAVPKRLAQLLAETQTLELLFGASLRGDVVATVSHQHIYGLLFKVLWPLATHRPFFAESLQYPEQLSAAVADRDAVVVSGPAHLKRIPETLDWSAAPTHISQVFSSGGPLSLNAAVLVERLLGTAPVEVYGSSETGGVAWRQRSGGLDGPWSAMPTVNVRAENGRLSVRSPHLPTSEWFVVEDYAEFDADGRFTLNGRADRLAKIEGKRVSLAAMEAALMATQLVADIRLVQLESSRDEIGALVVPNTEGWSVIRERDVSELRRQLSASLAAVAERVAHPRRWRWVDTLPVNADGKTTNAVAHAAFEPTAQQLPTLHVLSSSRAEVELELLVSARLPVFDGHFPELPVLAGVVQLDWAILYGRRFFGIALPFRRTEALKFLRIYQPGPLLRLTLRWHAERRMLAFLFGSAKETHSSGRIFFAE